MGSQLQRPSHLEIQSVGTTTMGREWSCGDCAAGWHLEDPECVWQQKSAALPFASSDRTLRPLGRVRESYVQREMDHQSAR